MTTEEIGLYDAMKGMYLSGASVKSIVETYCKPLFGYEIINALDSIKVELTPEEIHARKLNKVRVKYGKLQRKRNAIYDKQLHHEERERHFKAKKLVTEQSLEKLQACIDKLNTV